ncbi:hypothetical protein D3C85_1610080 [compost metagenome]
MTTLVAALLLIGCVDGASQFVEKSRYAAIAGCEPKRNTNAIVTKRLFRISLDLTLP